MYLNLKVLFLVALVFFASAITIISVSFQIPKIDGHWLLENLSHRPSDILPAEAVDCPGG